MPCYTELHFFSDIPGMPEMCLLLTFHLSVKSHANWWSCSIYILECLQFRNEPYEKTAMSWIKVVPCGSIDAVSLRELNPWTYLLHFFLPCLKSLLKLHFVHSGLEKQNNLLSLYIAAFFPLSGAMNCSKVTSKSYSYARFSKIIRITLCDLLASVQVMSSHGKFATA